MADHPVLVCDGGERYLDTIYSDDWVREKIGDIEHHWMTEAKEA